MTTYLLDDYYISKPWFIGNKPDFKIPIQEIISAVLNYFLPKVNKYYLATWGPNPKTGIWEETDKTEKIVSKYQQEAFDILNQLFKRDQNNTDFELYLFKTDLTKDSIFSWSLGDFIDLKILPTEFTNFQRSLKISSLPETLFYEKGSEITAPLQSTHFVSKIFNALGYRRNYTPMEWTNLSMSKIKS